MSEQMQAAGGQDVRQPILDRFGIEKEAELLKSDAQKLSSFGGFSLIESAIEGASDLSPEHEARRNIFLTDSQKKPERERLEKALSIWADMLESNHEISGMISFCGQQAEKCEKVRQQQLAKAVEQSKDLERAYRNVDFFFRNAEGSRLKNVSFVNCAPDQLKDLEDTRFMDAVAAELDRNYDRLDLRDNYSIMVIPGYLGSNNVIEKWAKIAFKNKVMMVTDFEHLEAPDDVMELFDQANLTSGDTFKSNVMMSCNWLTGRGRYSELGEQEDLYVPPSGALAGKIYCTLMSQVTAGKKFGVIHDAAGVKFDLRKNEIANLEKMGLVPMVREGGRVMAFSAKTLFNGDNLGLQTYSVVRVFDYVTKVMMDILNRRAFENFNTNTRKELMNQIVKFLDSITGPDKLIEDFTIRRFEQDPAHKDRIHLDIHLKPYFPAKNFLINMQGKRGDDGNEWDTTYDQDK